jgi:hypothetical protein
LELEEALVAYLLEYPGLTTLIGQRLYPDELSQGEKLPAVLYFKVSDVKDHTLAGQNKLERPIFQMTVFAVTKTDARAVANKIKTALNDYVGFMGGIFIQKIELQNELSNLETSSDGIIKVYTEDLEYQINYIKG